jgi:hypothetical protein
MLLVKSSCPCSTILTYQLATVRPEGKKRMTYIATPTGKTKPARVFTMPVLDAVSEGEPLGGSL